MISMIAVIGLDNELGYENDLLWRLPNDLKYFKLVTSGKKIIMGHNTFLSLGRPLPNRENIVITRDYFEDVTIMSVEDVLGNYLDSGEEVFVIGGGKIYSVFLEYATKLYLTEVPLNAQADVFFPEFSLDEYDVISKSQNNDAEIFYEHKVYERKRK